MADVQTQAKSAPACSSRVDEPRPSERELAVGRAAQAATQALSTAAGFLDLVVLRANKTRCGKRLAESIDPEVTLRKQVAVRDSVLSDVVQNRSLYLPGVAAKRENYAEHVEFPSRALGEGTLQALLTADLFRRETVSDVLAGVLKTEVDFGALLGSTPPAIRGLVRRCPQRKTRNRLRDIADARIMLDEALSGAPVEGARRPCGRDRGVRRREKLLGGGLAAMAFVAAGLGWALWRGARGAPSPPHSLSVVLRENLRLVSDAHDCLAISLDGRGLAIAAEDDAAQRLYVREFGSPGLRRLPGTGGASSPFLSSDGRWVGFSQDGLKNVSLDGGTPVSVAPRISEPGRRRLPVHWRESL